MAGIFIFSVCFFSSLIQQLYTEDLLSGRHYSRHWGYTRKWDRENSLSSRSRVGTNRKYGKKEVTRMSYGEECREARRLGSSWWGEGGGGGSLLKKGVRGVPVRWRHLGRDIKGVMVGGMALCGEYKFQVRGTASAKALRQTHAWGSGWRGYSKMHSSLYLIGFTCLSLGFVMAEVTWIQCHLVRYHTGKAHLIPSPESVYHPLGYRGSSGK